MSYFLTAIISAIAGGVFVYFFLARIHKDAALGWQIAIDEAHKARVWAEEELAKIKAGL